jgi:hypothetical protein
MSRNTILAVGGTGTHVAISFLRMAVMSNMSIADVPNIIVVDADSTAGENASLIAIAKKLYDQVVEGSTINSRPIWQHIAPYRGSTAEVQAVSANTAFGEYLLGESMDTAKPESKQLLDALFTRAEKQPVDGTFTERSEQDILIKDGFFARPNVGATSVYDLLGVGDSDLSRRLLGALAGNQGYKGIAVVGSSTGGTGSGGAPAIAQWLQKEKNNPNRQGADARVALFMTLPWFFPTDPIDPIKEEASYGSRETQRFNAASGIRLYAQSASLQNAGVFIADYNGIQTIRKNEGNRCQSEHPHPLPLIFASQIQNFFLNAERAHGQGAKSDLRGVVGEYTFFHTQSDQQAEFVIDAHNSALVAFSTSSELRQDIYYWAMETQAMRLILKCIADFIAQGYRIHQGNERRERKQAFIDLMLTLARKNFGEAGIEDEPGSGWLGFKKRLIETESVRSGLVIAIRAREKELAESISWLNTLEANSESEGRKTFKIDNNAIQARLELSDCKRFPIFTEKNVNPMTVIMQFFDKAFDQQKESPDKGVDLSNMLENLCTLGLVPFSAAVVTIETQIRAVIREQQAQQLKVRNADFLAPNMQGVVPSYLLPLRGVGEEAINQYAARIDIQELVDDAIDRNGRNLKKHDPGHPFTITGISSASIPSPWAAAHYQTWLQLNGDDVQQRHALNSFEAIMWGVFTKRFKLVSLSIENTRLAGMLRNSLESELNNPNFGQMTHIVAAVDTKKDDQGRMNVIGTNHPDAGWFVAPWLLKSQKAQEWWRMPHYAFDLPSAAVKDKLNPTDFSSRQIASFVEGLRKMAEHHKINANVDRAVPWYLMVTKLIAELAPFVSSITPVPYEQDDGHGILLFGRNANGVYEFKRFGIPVLSKSLPEILKNYIPSALLSIAMPNGEVRHPDVPVFSKHLSQIESCERIKEESLPSTSGGVYFTLTYRLVIKDLGEALIHCQSKKVDLDAWLAIFPNFRADGWEHYHFGCTHHQHANVQDQFSFAVFDRKGNCIGADKRSFRTNHEIIGVPHYVSLSGDGSDDAQFINGEFGVFELALSTLPQSDLSFKLGLDIGTSHSCFFPMTAAGAPIRLDFSNCATQLTYVVFDDASLSDLVIENNIFLGVHSSNQVNAVEKLVLPSELKVQDRVGETVSLGMLSDKEYSKHFSTVPYEYAIASSATRRGRRGEFLTDFKWSVGDTVNHGLADTQFSTSQSEILSVYLRQILLTGFAMLRLQGYRTMSLLRVTYPESFNYTFLSLYAKGIDKELNRVTQTTGFTLNLGQQVAANLAHELLANQRNNAQAECIVTPGVNESCFVSESLSAFSAAGQDRNTAGRGITLVLDMGGGTTDIAVYAKELGKTDANLESITDSIKYAGNDVLEILNTDQVFELMARSVNPHTKPETYEHDEDAKKIRMSLIKRLMRNPNSINSLKIALNQGDLPEISMRINAFFTGITKYATLLVKSYQDYFESNKDEGYWDVKIILLGNGWKLTDLIFHNNGVAASGYLNRLRGEIEKSLSNRDVRVNAIYNTGADINVKEAIAYGALKIDEDPRLAKLSAHKVVPGMGINIIKNRTTRLFEPTKLFEAGYTADELRSPNAIEVDRNTMNFLDSDMLEIYSRLVSENDQKRILAGVTVQLNDSFANHIRIAHGTSPLKISPYGIFLEKCWKRVCI